MKKKMVSEKEFNQFRRHFPFSCVDLVIFLNDSILLSKRAISPYKGKWHLPGGIIRKHEKLEKAVLRAGKEELNLKVKIVKFIGVFENLNDYRHDLSHAFIVSILDGKIRPDFQSSQLKFFKKMPSNMIPYHRKIIHKADSMNKISGLNNV